MSSFREISGKSAESRADLYRSHIDMLIKKKDTDALYQLVDHLIIKEGADQFGRTYITPDVLVYLVSALEDKEQVNKDPIAVEDLTPLLEKIVSAIRSKADDFPDALMEASWLLSQCYQANDDAKAAAGVLSSFKMDAKCSASNERRVDWYVTTAEFYLDTDDGAGAAMMQIKRAHGLVNEVKDRELLFRFKLTYARVLDADKKFLEASLRYMEISQTAMGIFDESKILTALECAITCAIIAKAGSSRSRVLAMLYSDERSMHLPNFGMLEKMFKERIIRKSELEQFVKSLQDHQNALGPGGRTIPEIAVTEHNILAIAKLYQNISFDELGALLSLPAKTAESLAAKMVEQGRLKAVVDQIEGLVEFSHGSDSGASAVAGSGGVLGEWNSSIGELCLLLNKVTDQIATKHPQYKL